MKGLDSGNGMKVATTPFNPNSSRVMVKNQGRLKNPSSHGGKRSCNRSSMATKGKRNAKKLKLLQEFLCSPEDILKKVFRKDGPPLGVEFDSLPSTAFPRPKGPRNARPFVKENPKVPKGRKVVKPLSDSKAICNKNYPLKKHGIGKGLMTLWRVANPGGGNFPTGVDLGTASVAQSSTSKSRKPPSRNKRPRKQKPATRRQGNKLENKNKSIAKRRKLEYNADESHQKMCKGKCELALVGTRSEECLGHWSELVDDEELELRELQAGPNPLTCSAHFATNGWHCCSLCKDLLAKFPPNAVKMRHPLSVQPWDSSPELVKKLFKVFHFLYTYAVTIDIFPFTLVEFARSFLDKDSLLLGKIHVSLLKFLLSSVEMELSSGCIPRVSKNFLFVGLLHSVERQEFVVKLWKQFLNPLTWTEILRQVLIAAGFGSKEDSLRIKYLNKEADLMVKYGLRPGTLKCTLFNVLSEQGNNGMKVSDLAKSLQIGDLNLAGTTDELELLISSSLASDITLFEKISPSAYRLRINSGTEEAENFHSDPEDSGSIDDDSKDSGANSGDSECDSLTGGVRKRSRKSHCKGKNNRLAVYTEIDESNPGEVWLLGLMEGEYSDLSIEEKLDALLALVDLLGSASSISMEDPVKAIADPKIHHVGSGAKIKRSSPNGHNLLRTSWVHAAQMPGTRVEAPSEIRPVDSLASISNFCSNEKSSGETEDDNELEVEVDIHPMQSIFLGSDRRYNRYWLFLGPCNLSDPGHKRIYFESSEDGQWEVIDTEQALCSLLSALDNRGRREALLLASLEKRETFLRQEMSSRITTDAGNIQFAQSDRSEIDMIREDSSSPVSGVDNNICSTEMLKDSLVSSGDIVDRVEKKEDERQKWSRIQAFDAWIWNSFYSNLNVVKHCKRSYFDSLMRCESCHDLYWRDEKHCKTCHLTFELDFDLEERYAIHAATCREREDLDMFPKHKILSSQLQSLKAAIHAIESCMPKDAMVGAWTKSAHNLWIKRLRRTSSLSELLQVLSDFVGAMREDWLSRSNIAVGTGTALEEISAHFPAMPQTSSAVALWLVKLDALIAPCLEIMPAEKIQERNTRSKGKRVQKQ